MISIRSGLNGVQGAIMREVSLSELNPGEHAEIVSFAPAGEAREKLLRLGVVPGISLEVTNVSEDSGPMKITIMGSRLNIARADADKIRVKRFE